jgi:hypothetical protein
LIVCVVDWFAYLLFVLDWIGLDWIGLDWIGLDWIGLDWIGLDWIGLFVCLFDCLIVCLLISICKLSSAFDLLFDWCWFGSQFVMFLFVDILVCSLYYFL